MWCRSTSLDTESFSRQSITEPNRAMYNEVHAKYSNANTKRSKRYRRHLCHANETVEHNFRKRHPYMSGAGSSTRCLYGYDDVSDGDSVKDNYQPHATEYFGIEESCKLPATDPFRVFRRPSVKTLNNVINRPTNGIPVMNVLNHTCKLSQRISLNDESHLKLSVQHFDSAKQLRVFFSDLRNFNQVCSEERGIKLYFKVTLISRKGRRTLRKLIRTFNNTYLNSVCYFHGLCSDDVNECQLLVRLCKKQR